ncbi:MraY family glycosyltransferase [Paraburkholderia terricola]|uniref:UDP-N-acetylmuramyl pentapeptide phosphotransferase/UDP-N-acetylglucosamine-1-phosphate transferase n=1 Tax=Paraburkholderia terricola TaxID=169427 RepID=A0A1M6V1L7_9BURK|nr:MULTISPECIES: glycosyltransferase family 4 protein [Paraburkholderia]SDO93956.1 UDP-N-acetylmuramyl pentapeptide phosphotransferase/UDP-N-acetylglucosamine-1-phosphate transferase [Paraburkholderia sediminicola]SHK75328.1 UDP-N-acetylmuramyl pentapeptide phosphotransferase/UDP-N-acetylglucosamine-1-phosphate transferase [Paraburkholderia terricola]
MIHPVFPFFIDSPWISAACVAAVSLAACALILLTLLRTGLAWRLATDVPNERSLHTLPTPRVGGWGIIPVSVLAMLIATPTIWLAAVLAAALAAVSQIDDRRGLPARVRFAAHFAAVAVFVWAHPAPAPLWLLAGLSFLLLWLVNLYNFMDGADGLAGGMSLFGFAGYALGAAISGHPSPELTLASGSVAGAAAGFLIFNFHPAKIFLGDAGSIPLGFLAGAFGYWGWSNGVWPIWFPALVFSPFIGDASVTLLRRLLRGEKIWQAHREHYYQRMVQYGLGHSKTALLWYAVMVAGIVLAVGLLGWPSTLQWCSVGAWAIVLILMGIGVDSRWRRFRIANSEQPEV